MELDDRQVLFVIDKFYVKEVTIQRSKRLATDFEEFGVLGEFLTFARDDGVIIVDGIFDDGETIFINLTLVKEAKIFVEENRAQLLVRKILTIQGAMQNRPLMEELKRLLPKISIDQLPELLASPNQQMRKYARDRLEASGVEIDPADELKETPIAPFRERRYR